MNSNKLNAEYLQSLSYQELKVLGKQYNVFKHRVKKASLIKKLIGLENNEAEIVRKPAEPKEVMLEDENGKENEFIEDVRSKSPESNNVRRQTFDVTSSNISNEVIEEKNTAPQCDDIRRLTFSITPSDSPKDPLEQSLLKNSKSLVNLGPLVEKSENAICSRVTPEIYIAKASIVSAVKCGRVTFKSVETKPQITIKKTSPCHNLIRTPASQKISLLAASGHKTPRTITRSFSTNNCKIPASQRKLFGTESGRKLGTLPNFRAIHEKQFKNMESLVEGRERKAKRALNLLTPVALKKSSAIPRPNNLMKDNKAGSFIGSNLNLNKSNPALPKLKKHNIERMVRDKQSSVSIESARIKSKMHVTGVRTNRRFELHPHS